MLQPSEIPWQAYASHRCLSKYNSGRHTHTHTHAALPQVDGDMSVATLKAILEAETNVPAARQTLVLGTNPLRDIK